MQHSALQLATDKPQLAAALAAARAAGKRVGLVPTMGALHRGHLSLVAAARAECDFTVATIFVNPTQFGPREDFSKYPRTLEADLEKLRQAGCDLVFAPSTDQMYPASHATSVHIGGVAEPLEGKFRPGHFDGVATIVLKLFHMIPADLAFFGRKDFQQALVVRQMARDLDVPIEIRVCPIVREPDGLALSSRNVYLSPDERRQALALSRSLRLAQSLVEHGERDAKKIVARMTEEVLAAGPTRIEYIEIADPDTLAPRAQAEPGSVALIAAHVGTTRLIDNELL